MFLTAHLFLSSVIAYKAGIVDGREAIPKWAHWFVPFTVVPVWIIIWCHDRKWGRR